MSGPRGGDQPIYFLLFHRHPEEREAPPDPPGCSGCRTTNEMCSQTHPSGRSPGTVPEQGPETGRGNWGGEGA